MIAKITKGKGFYGVVNYILDENKSAKLLDSEGLRLKNKETMIQSFVQQSRLNNRVTKPVYHISLDFSAKDKAKITNDLMVKIAKQYMDKMDVTNTQYIIARHFDKEHPHIHIVVNRVNYDGKTISDRNDRIRSAKICKELTHQHGLYFAPGKDQVKVHRLREPDKTKYQIYQSLKDLLPKCKSWQELNKRLQKQGITIVYKYKGKTNEIQGITFTKNDLSFNGSKVDRQFSFSKIDDQLNENRYKQNKTVGVKDESRCSDIFKLGKLLLTPEYEEVHKSNRDKRQQKRKSKKKGYGPKI